MKILMSGTHNPHFFTITEYIEDAIKTLGHEVVPFEDRNFIFPGRVRQTSRFVQQIDLKMLNKKLLKLVDETSPDILLVTGGHRILSATVKKFKEKKILTVLWTIDVPIDFQPIIDVAPDYDYVFCGGTEAVEILKKERIKNLNWLPFACDPAIHRPVKVTDEDRKKYGSDIVFVGSHYPNREKILEELTSFDLSIWGPGWRSQLSKDSKLNKCVKGNSVVPEEWRKIFSSSKIVIVVHYQDPEGEIPCYQASPKVYESLACGAFVLADKQKDMITLFTPETHLSVFENRFDLKNKIEYYLKNPDKRRKIANAGKDLVTENHAFTHRIRKLLSVIEKGPCSVNHKLY